MGYVIVLGIIVGIIAIAVWISNGNKKERHAEIDAWMAKKKELLSEGKNCRNCANFNCDMHPTNDPETRKNPEAAKEVQEISVCRKWIG